MHFVSIKTRAQQDLQALHRVRSERVCRRTAKVNQIRGLMAEYGIIAPRGIQQLRRAIPRWLEDDANGISGAFRVLLSELQDELVSIDRLIDSCDKRIAQAVKDDPVSRRLLTLRGVGPLTASALSLTLGDGSTFQKGREFAASLGLVPRQHTTGDRVRLLGISKRGDNYLRTLLVHGARSVLRFIANRDDPLSRWLKQLSRRKHRNVVGVALANKTARVAWAMVRYDRDYESSMMVSNAT
jgi:transposase